MTTLEKVMSVVSRETGAGALDASTFIDSLGLDSLEYVSLMLAVSNEVADVPEAEWININTLGKLAEACERHL